MQADFDGKIAVVTGSTQGLGAAIARQLAERGAAGVLITGRDAGRGTRMVDEIEHPGLRSLFVEADLADPASPDVIIDAADEAFGRIDVLINSAGITDRRTFEKVRDSIDLLMEGRVDYEFRMTVVPALHRASDLQRVAEQIKGARRFVLQNYVPRDTLDPAFLSETPYDAERLEEFKNMMAPMFDECLIRGES